MENVENLGFNEITYDEKSELNGGVWIQIIRAVVKELAQEAAEDFGEGFQEGYAKSRSEWP